MRSLWLDGTKSFADLDGEPVPCLIDGVLDVGSTAFLTGQPATGKSLLAISLAAAVASGTPWNGRDTTQGCVLYVVAEDSPARIRDRFLAWSAHNQIPINFDVLRYADGFDFSKPESVDFMVDLVASHVVRLVIVDTLFSASVNLDTESAKDVKVINDVIARVKAASLLPLTFMTVSHANKSQPGQISGSLQLKGLADTVLAMTKSRGVYRLSFDKNRHGSEDLTMDFGIETVELPWVTVATGVLVATKNLPNTKSTKAEQVLLDSLPPSGNWVSGGELQKQAEANGIGKTAFYAARKALLEAGKLISRENARGSDLKSATEFGFGTVQNEQPELEQVPLVSVRSVSQPYKGLELNSENKPQVIDDDELF